MGLVYGLSPWVCFGLFLGLDFFRGSPWAWFGAWFLWGLFALGLGLTSLGFFQFGLFRFRLGYIDIPWYPAYVEGPRGATEWTDRELVWVWFGFLRA